jgi:ABC-2 type transport system ATP-binding protein
VGAVQAPALSVEDLVVRYGDTLAVDRASFAVTAGTVLALLGPNGAGKTSLVETCEGYRRPSDGTVRTLGRDPWAERDRLMPRVGIMLQGGGLHPWARTDELLRLFASYAAQPLPLDVLVDRLGLGDFLRTRYRRLSGGQKQRLALALAIVGRPELVFLDEPTAGMDAQARRATWDVITALRADGVSVLLTTHLLDEAERLADDVVIVRAGRVVATGSPLALTTVAEMSVLHVTASPGLLPPLGLEVSPGRYVFEGPFDAAGAAAVLGWFAGRGAHVTAVSSQRPSLEDVYLAMTAEVVS